MIYTVCAYYDVEIKKFNTPFCVPFNLDDTIESVKDGVIKGKIENADAFELFHLGQFSTDDGKFELNEKPEFVLKLSEYVKERS